ncbi:hypothetical protein Tco_1213740 [Tanacetum coccineum]
MVAHSRIRQQAMPIDRPIVKYSYGNDAKDYGEFDKGEKVRAFVKDTCKGSGSKLGAPVARLSGDCDSDVDSVDGVVDMVWLYIRGSTDESIC